MQPKVASAGSKRIINLGIDPLDDEGAGNFWTGIIAILHDRACLSCYNRDNLLGDPPGEWRVRACRHVLI